ncbi:peptidylprolyl isomerase [Rhodoferax mekongensis]|uniref:Periplasmic chaperone PpiD n=1 Tax=Rhodoferax mekongensis TaxID=3068341 RepID=A0ABZ0AXX0_9BURK|nr:SurA N-terminal domain-containing protein [Rhodoferax sp. TBRC 17307]WNO04021.1 SurA N-terminal domain-containing protein [Rhodoferax sp. TBRC 17307]
MFDFVRKHTKVLMFLMFLLIIPAFVLVGVDGYKSMAGRGATVATIGNAKITQEEWDFAHKNEVDRLRASVPNLDPKLLDSAEARYATLERLVREKVMAEAVQTAHMTTSNARLARELQQNPTIASLRKPDGTLDMERYRQLAASQGLTPEGFEARVRRDLSLMQVESAVTGTAFSPKALSDLALNAFFERREVQVLRFSPADYASKINPSDADIDAYFQANSALFQSTETANVEYVVLDLEAVKKTVSVNEADLKTYFEQNASRLSAKEERRASHILINAPKDMPAADRAKAKERATALLAQVRKAPDSFAEVAKKNSQDAGSAPRGGDLDFFGRGAMVKPFEDAAFSMKKGEISDLVESDFGFHIIKLVDVKGAKQPTFEEARASLEPELRAQLAQRKFAEVAEAFTNGVYEQSDSLKPVAERLKLEVKTATNVQRQPLPGAADPLANPKLLEAIFSTDSLEKKRNTEALELGANQLVSARVVAYSPARPLALNEVKAQVRERLVASRALEQAKKEGTEKLAALQANPSAVTMPAAVTLSRDAAQGLAGAVVDAALKVNPAKLPGFAGADVGAQGYVVVRVNKVLPRNAVEEAKGKQEQAQYAQWVAASESSAYYESLKQRFKVQIKVPAPGAAKTAQN